MDANYTGFLEQQCRFWGLFLGRFPIFGAAEDGPSPKGPEEDFCRKQSGVRAVFPYIWASAYGSQDSSMDAYKTSTKEHIKRGIRIRTGI